MRYMGDWADDLGLQVAMTPMALDPTVKANMMAQAKTLPDDKAHDLLDIADETPYGHRQKMIRMAEGAAAGVILGLIIAALRWKKR